MKDEKEKGKRIKDKNLEYFLNSKIFHHPSTEIIFNQYAGDIKGLDRKDGAKLRRENLFGYLSSLKRQPSILLLGEAPGPWGCRFSGIPFTGEAQLVRGELPFSGQQSSLSQSPYSERSGTVFWGLLKQHHPDFFVWNTIPFHPHRPDDYLSVRNPRWSEVKEYLPLLSELLDILKPKQIAAIGRVAEKALKTIGRDCVYVRHPSYGGVKLFREGMEKIFTTY
jgi:uracil-DNA glycosylase